MYRIKYSTILNKVAIFISDRYIEHTILQLKNDIKIVIVDLDT